MFNHSWQFLQTFAFWILFLINTRMSLISFAVNNRLWANQYNSTSFVFCSSDHLNLLTMALQRVIFTLSLVIGIARCNYIDFIETQTSSDPFSGQELISGQWRLSVSLDPSLFTIYCSKNPWSCPCSRSVERKVIVAEHLSWTQLKTISREVTSMISMARNWAIATILTLVSGPELKTWSWSFCTVG